jgi:hypothetical protein
MFEGPSIDTGRFPIPDGLRFMLDATQQRREFNDLCFDACHCLYIHREEIEREWEKSLAKRDLVDPKLQSEIKDVIKRLAIPRDMLEKELDGGKIAGKLRTSMKNMTWALGQYAK